MREMTEAETREYVAAIAEMQGVDPSQVVMAKVVPVTLDDGDLAEMTRYYETAAADCAPLSSITGLHLELLPCRAPGSGRVYLIGPGDVGSTPTATSNGCVFVTVRYRALAAEHVGLQAGLISRSTRVRFPPPLL